MGQGEFRSVVRIGFEGVFEKLGDDLLDFVGIGVEGEGCVVDVQAGVGEGRKGGGEVVDGLQADGFEVDIPGLSGVLAEVGEEFAADVGGVLSGAEGAAEEHDFIGAGAVAVGVLHEHEFEVAHDGLELVVEVVGDAAGHLGEAGGFLFAFEFEEGLGFFVEFGLEFEEALADVDAGEEFDGGDGFGEVIVGAGFEALDFVGCFAAVGEKDEIGVAGFGGADGADDIGAVEFGHHPVEDGHGGRFGAEEEVEGGLSVGAFGDLKAAFAEEADGHGAGDGVVIGNEDVHGLLRG